MRLGFVDEVRAEVAPGKAKWWPQVTGLWPAQVPAQGPVHSSGPQTYGVSFRAPAPAGILEVISSLVSLRRVGDYAHAGGLSFRWQLT
jgi:hypothetical protein